MFIDRAKIQVKGGRGGDGMSGFRREKYVPRGGPSGGDGGRGGNIVLLADENINTLVDFRYRRKFEAQDGGRGGMSNCFGAAAEDILVKVPVGTLVYDEQKEILLADLKTHGQKLVAARGGRGGRGNAKFADSVHRAPTFAEKGEPGEARPLRLELKLLADVGLVGYPSVGKSSIIAKVSAARPEIAAYHFTTLSPVLGVVKIDDDASFVLADIPGLIEGAHGGAGLGHDFLRHVERTRVIVHVVDASGLEGRDPAEDFDKINKELALYSERLAARPQIVAANKMDLPEAREHYARLAAHVAAQGFEIMPVSAADGEGLTELTRRAFKMLADAPRPEEDYAADILPEEDGNAFSIARADDGTFLVSGQNIEKLVAMTDFANDEGLKRFQRIWRHIGIEAALRERGIKEGDSVRIADMLFDFAD
jgi:GTP-binding protein